jgi:uncharacterized membrane protein YjfL (UPF0719 family)
MFQSLEISAGVAAWALGQFAALLGVLFVGRLVYRLTVKADSSAEIVQRGNTAMAVALSGFMVGLGIAASGALLSPAAPETKTLLIIGSGLASIALMRLSLFINDKLILSKFSNIAEITKDQNVGVAFVEAGNCLATGFMIYAVMTCQSLSLEDKVKDGLIYWAIGQALLILGARVFAWTLPYDAQNQIEGGNSAAGLVFGGFLLSLGLVLMTAISGATSEVLDELPTIGLFYVIGMVLLVGSRLVSKLLVPAASLSNMTKTGRVAPACIEFAGLVCVAVLFASSLAPANSSTIFSPAQATVSVDQPVPAEAPLPDATIAPEKLLLMPIDQPKN